MYLSLKFLNKLTSERLSTFVSERHLKLNAFPRIFMISTPNIIQISMFLPSMNEIPQLLFPLLRNLGPTFGTSISLTPYIYYIRKISHVILQIDQIFSLFSISTTITLV